MGFAGYPAVVIGCADSYWTEDLRKTVRCGWKSPHRFHALPCMCVGCTTWWIYLQAPVQTQHRHERLRDHRYVHDGGAAFGIRVTRSCDARVFSTRVIGARFVQTAWRHGIGMFVLNLIAEMSQPNTRHVDGCGPRVCDEDFHFSAWDDCRTPVYA